jgi:hypothetical protein
LHNNIIWIRGILHRRMCSSRTSMLNRFHRQSWKSRLSITSCGALKASTRSNVFYDFILKLLRIPERDDIRRTDWLFRRQGCHFGDRRCGFSAEACHHQAWDGRGIGKAMLHFEGHQERQAYFVGMMFIFWKAIWIKIRYDIPVVVKPEMEVKIGRKIYLFKFSGNFQSLSGNQTNRSSRRRNGSSTPSSLSWARRSMITRSSPCLKSSPLTRRRSRNYRIRIVLKRNDWMRSSPRKAK